MEKMTKLEKEAIMKEHKEDPLMLLETIKKELYYQAIRLDLEKDKMAEEIDKVCLIFEKINEHIEDCLKQNKNG